MGERRYTDSEAARIVQAAIEMQGGSQDAGLRLADLQRIGAELGVEPDLIAEAAARADRNALLDGGQTRFLGAPPQYEVSRVTDSPVTEGAWERIVAELDRTYGKGEVRGGNVRSWHRKGELGWVDLSLTPERGRTRLRLVTYIDDGLSAGLVGAIGVMAMAAGTVFGNFSPPWWAIVPILLAIAFGTLYGFRRLASGWLKRDRRKSEGILDEIEHILTTSAPALDHRGVIAEPERVQVLR